MEPDDRDTEIFERIPWEALEKRGERRWWVYVVAAALFMGGLGVTIGRTTGPPTAPADIESEGLVPITEPMTVEPPSTNTSTTIANSGTWAEADLLAAPVPALETAAASLAEWFVVDHFTRDGSGGSGGISGRSFVDWAGPIGFEWVESGRAEVTILVRRLAVGDEGPYRRLPDEAWTMTLALDGTGWKIVDGPFPAEPPAASVEIGDLDPGVPAQVAAMVGDQRVLGASRIGSGWLVEVEWTDEAGLRWPIRRRLPDQP